MLALGCSIISQSEIKCRALIYQRIGPHATAMTMDNSLYDGQPYTCALVILAIVKPLEDAKELILITHIEADAIVADAIDLGFRACDLDPGGFPRASVLESVREQIDEHLF